MLHKLTQKAAQRLRSHGMLARSFYISLHYLRGGKWTHEIMVEPTDDSLILARIASRLWRERPHHSESVLKVSMVLGRLTYVGNYTPSLFTEENTADNLVKKPHEKLHLLNETMDKLVQKFGRQSIYLGGAHNAMESAPMRISFGHIPDLDVEGD